MTSGIVIYQNDGQVVDLTTAGATFVDLVTVGADASGTLSYSSLVGRTIMVGVTSTSATAFGLANCVISYPSGVPTINYSPTGGPSPHSSSQIMVFSK